MEDLEKLAAKRAKQREYQRAYEQRKKNGESPRPPGRPANTPEVLWSKVDIKGEDECWPWKGALKKDGYGRVQINEWNYYAHRVIFNLAYPGVIELKAPKSYAETGFLLHTCDNPSCCNPKHLESGTQADNVKDMWLRNRAKPQGKTPFTLADYQQVIKEYKDGVTVQELTKKWKRDRSTISGIVNGWYKPYLKLLDS